MSEVSLISIGENNPAPREMPRHIAIIMDGNGRWAKERGLPRVEGHRKGVETVRAITRIAGEAGLDFLTLYSFSSENWARPKSEINELFGLLRLFIRRYLAELHQRNVKISIIGDQDGIPEDILKLMKEAVDLTYENTGLTLVIAFNYGARAEIAKATRKIAEAVLAGEVMPDDITPDLVNRYLQTNAIPDPDLIIRTSGEQRLSNFLLWQAAYSEFVFAKCNWPDFGKEAFFAAIDEYYGRERRFGAVATVKGG